MHLSLRRVHREQETGEAPVWPLPAPRAKASQRTLNRRHSSQLENCLRRATRSVMLLEFGVSTGKQGAKDPRAWWVRCWSESRESGTARLPVRASFVLHYFMHFRLRTGFCAWHSVGEWLHVIHSGPACSGWSMRNLSVGESGVEQSWLIVANSEVNTIVCHCNPQRLQLYHSLYVFSQEPPIRLLGAALVTQTVQILCRLVAVS